jgi:hypothetical protein
MVIYYNHEYILFVGGYIVMKKVFIKFLLLALVTTQYTVLGNDTLQGIAEKFCRSNNRIEVAEFREGIREINYDMLGEREVKEGMVLAINQFK